ncbi:MAG: 30S ribosomal protein S27ae [Candidatus Nanohaloarchaea archaeon]
MGKHAKVSRQEKYNEDGEYEGEKCPRCSSFLADHGDRKSCGKCGYTKHE